MLALDQEYHQHFGVGFEISIQSESSTPLNPLGLVIFEAKIQDGVYETARVTRCDMKRWYHEQ